ncbi:hypothetical protein [Chryseobacterium caseinilyticum]|uniref:Uncharacterized protein n=1 Tax=Chryseobacterium caseinilyticum TaxID=2771428 RepID=A0ABR8Z740_9FLAO|nr:hypothetical protein [Chryseobacterium caseinilyticum]MBD8081099.1 hypothetical protein [Chryseobacterium caseinilyticum]
MKKHLTFVNNSYQAKNKLDTAILEFLQSNDRLIIDSKDLPAFKENVLQHIHFLNQENKRCTPKTPKWFTGLKKNDFHITGVDVISFYIYEIKSEYEVTNSNN